MGQKGKSTNRYAPMLVWDKFKGTSEFLLNLGPGALTILQNRYKPYQEKAFTAKCRKDAASGNTWRSMFLKLFSFADDSAEQVTKCRCQRRFWQVPIIISLLTKYFIFKWAKNVLLARLPNVAVSFFARQRSYKRSYLYKVSIFGKTSATKCWIILHF